MPALPLSPWMIACLVFASFCAGLVDSIAGGGGLITVPALLATGLPAPIAFATNKGQASFGAISSFISFWSKGNVDRDRAPLGFIAGFLGSLVGARILLLIDPKPLKPIIIVLLLAAAAFVAYPRKPTTGTAKPWAMRALFPIGVGLGFYDGFFGPGTGSILIVLFVMVFGDTLTRASGNAKVVNLGSNLAALLLFSIKGAVLWSIAAPMAVANALGAFVGARLAIKGGDRFVRVVVLAVVAALVAKMLYDLVKS